MSALEQALRQVRNNRRRRKRLLDVDLNAPPPIENGDQPDEPVAQGEHSHFSVAQSSQINQARVFPPPGLINVEDIDDDDVIISSPRSFEEARNNSRRNQARTGGVDVEETEEMMWIAINQRNKRRRAGSNQPVINLEGSSSSMRGTPPPPPPPPEPTFTCPICMGALVEEMTTKCGHIFCKACIKAAIAAQAKCPTCRRKVTKRDIIRVYLPTTN